jgi:hypothetical protein
VAIHQGAGWADLQARAAADAGRFAHRHTSVGDHQAARAAVFNVQGVVAHQVAAGAYAAAAQDTAVVVKHKIWMGGVHQERLPGGLDRPVSHILAVRRVLELAVAICLLAVHAEVVALTEKQVQHELPRLLDF